MVLYLVVFEKINIKLDLSYLNIRILVLFWFERYFERGFNIKISLGSFFIY